MINLWSGLVDQVAFVDYNPWENSYEKISNDIKEPCSDLWRRMFIWWDGKSNIVTLIINHCYQLEILKNNISNLWLSEEYNRYREEHLNFNRKKNKTLQFMHSSLKKNKKVLILGASSDIGMTVIEKFLQEDWYVLAR